MDKRHSEFDRPFREWFADRLSDFSKQLRDGQDPEITFVAKVGKLPHVIAQIRLVDLEGVYTREEFPIEVIENGRRSE